MMKYVKKIYNKIRSKIKKYLFLKRQPNTFNLTDKQLKKAFKLGFTPEEYEIYDLDRNDPKEYLSEFERMMFREKQAGKKILLDNKVVFYHLVKDLLPVNRVFAYKDSGTYASFAAGFEKENILKRLESEGKLVFKKTDAGGGEGFRLLEFRDASFWINREQAAGSDILKLLEEDNYLIEEYCVQSSFEDSLYPFSVNTIRLITVVDGGEIKVVAALHRMGVDQNKCVDNACAGGIYSEIDIHTGVLTAARTRGKLRLRDSNGNPIEYASHPITKTQIAGLQIPNWKEITKQVMEFHNTLLFTGLPLIAWDIALTNEGIKIIEANTSCGMRILQAFHGHRHTDFGKWMKKRGYIK